MRVPKFLPPLEGPDGLVTSAHLESTTLLLRMQVAVDYSSTDFPALAPVRPLAASPYQSQLEDISSLRGR